MAIRKVILGSLIALLVTAAGFAQAVKEKRVVMKMPKEACEKELAGHGMKGCCGELHLTNEQKAKMIDARYAHDQEVLAIKRDLEKKGLELKAELEKENPDKTALDRIFDETAALEAKIKKSKIVFAIAAKAILTKEQWSEAKERFLTLGPCGEPHGCGPGHEENRFFVGRPGGPQFLPGGDCGPEMLWKEKGMEKRIKIIKMDDDDEGPVTIRVEEDDD